MSKEFLDFINYIQIAQRAALMIESIERFDIDMRPGRCFIWITQRKDRTNNSYFYEAVNNYTSKEEIEEIKGKLTEYFEIGNKI